MRPPRLHDLPAPPPGTSGWPWTEEPPELSPTLPDGGPWPKISVVTPSYNQVAYLEETLRSVLLQGYPNLEYIVMDGGSDDGSAALIERYAPWLSHWQSQPDAGQSAAIADGFALTSGEVLAWLNSDDRYRPGALARVGRHFARHRRVAFVCGDVNHVEQSGRLIKRHYIAPPSFFVTANVGYHNMVQPACFWRRSAYERAGGLDRSLRFCMDRDLFLRLLRAGPARRLAGAPLADFRHHSEAKSSTIRDVRARESAMLMERYGSPYFRGLQRPIAHLWEAMKWPARLRGWAHRRWGVEL
jgi:glycosyltransferase involved in cell wall biosynthesis